MSTDGFAGQFAAKAQQVESAETSTTSWHGVRNLIAEQLGVKPKTVYVATISKPGNVRPRFFQSPAAINASVLVAMHTDDPRTVPATASAAKKIAVEREVSSIVAVRENGKWSVTVVMQQKGDRALNAIAEQFSDAVLLPI